MTSRHGNKHTGPAWTQGLLLWLLFCALAVLARGVDWDETLEHAQVLAGLVPYPPGHPLAEYVHRAFSIQTWLGAAMLRAGASAALFCGVRNVLFLLATVLPVFCLTTLLSRRAAWGSVAAALTLQGLLLEFDGSYPTAVWPMLYSNGHIGGAVVLLTLCAIAAERIRLAAFLTGALPCIHVGQSPVLLAVAAVFGVTYWRREGTAALRTPLLCFAAGLSVCILLWAVQRAMPAPPSAAPYTATADATGVYQGYTQFHDPHRQFPPENGQIALVGTLLLCVVAAWRTEYPAMRRACAWLGLYAAGIAAAVWGAMMLQTLLGPKTPFWVEVWMPYRLINHAGPIALAVAVAALRPERGRGSAILPLAALLAGALHPLWRALLGETLFLRYVAMGDAFTFALWGAAMAVLLAGTGRRGAAALLAAAGITAFAAGHHFGAACLLAGALAAALLRRTAIPPRFRPLPQTCAVIACCCIAALTAAGHQARYRHWLPTTPFLEQVRTTLPAGAMLATPPDAFLVQARSGHPVLTDTATASYISYLPHLGQSIRDLYLSLYGIDLTRAARPGAETWEAAWRTRTAEEWGALAAKYGFQYVIAPDVLDLQLQPLVHGRGETLYEVNARPGRGAVGAVGGEAGGDSVVVGGGMGPCCGGGVGGRNAFENHGGAEGAA